MYVKLCNFGKYTEGKSEPKPLQPDSGDECWDCKSLDFRYLTVHVTTHVSCFSPDASTDIHRKARVYRIVSLVLFVICVLLLIVVLVLFMKCKYDRLFLAWNLYNRYSFNPFIFAPAKKQTNNRRPIETITEFQWFLLKYIRNH